MRVHQTDRPERCEEPGCRATFKTAKALRRHASTHAVVCSVVSFPRFPVNPVRDSTLIALSGYTAFLPLVWKNVFPWVSIRS